jgi:hypothetical protein
MQLLLHVGFKSEKPFKMLEAVPNGVVAYACRAIRPPARFAFRTLPSSRRTMTLACRDA